jgi:hypothetical protein
MFKICTITAVHFAARAEEYRAAGNHARSAECFGKALEFRRKARDEAEKAAEKGRLRAERVMRLKKAA